MSMDGGEERRGRAPLLRVLLLSPTRTGGLRVRMSVRGTRTDGM
jgi:hypothetical protein